MVQFLADNLDQMDLALDQLSVNDRNFDRFALMLIDNVVELTIHKYAQHKAGENETRGRISDTPNDPKQVTKALGKNFDQKIKACCQLGLLNETLRDSILYLHQFRNTAYHQGLRHDGILHSLALFYFECACELMSLYEPRWWSWGGDDKISYRARKYIGAPGSTGHRKKFKSAFERLSVVAMSMPQALVEDLSKDMEKTITYIDEMISFLANDGPQKITRDEVIVNAQAWPFAFTEEAKTFAKEKGCTEQFMGPYVSWIANNYPWPAKVDPVDGWRKRQDSLTTECDKHKALKKYVDFMKQTEDIREKITESAAKLDEYIQEQIDILRGK